jgi:chemotaxis protein methyltransferase CheR
LSAEPEHRFESQAETGERKMSITAPEYEFMQKLILRASGIVLEPGKEYLVEARLAPIVREEKLESISAVIRRLQASSLDPLHKKVIDAMTTNETSFFRDQHPFDALRRVVLPDLLRRRAATKTLSIWCAASSSGQEPYTIAMTLFESIPAIRDWKITFLATDLSRQMIERSRAGRYSQLEVNRGLPAPMLVKYFRKDGLEWQVDDRFRSMIEFREMNLLQPWSKMPVADIVFIRNVLIYFDSNTKKDIFRRIRNVMTPDGYLFLGGAETTMNLDDSYQRMPIERSGVYQLRTAMAMVA